MNIEPKPNSLYYGDCLDIMRQFPNEYVDLICLDPPFNSKQNYHTIFKGSGLSIEPQLKAFIHIK
jgi:site-specific DNA-methyltransferase (adenine-specific)